jgi:hypothetical protein
MPLLRTAIQLGGAAALLNVGTKALDRHEKTRYEHDLQLRQQQQMMQQAQSQAAGLQAPKSHSRSASPGSCYQHQPYCNGSCGEQCNGPSGYQHQPYCNGTCEGRCNGASNVQRGRAITPQPPHQQQPYLNPYDQTQNLFESQGTIGMVESGNVGATPPSYEYESVHAGEVSGAVRDTKN